MKIIERLTSHQSSKFFSFLNDATAYNDNPPGTNENKTACFVSADVQIEFMLVCFIPYPKFGVPN